MNPQTIPQRLLPAAGIAALLALQCGMLDPDQAGNSTQTGNGMVVGMLYQPDGTTPAAGVRVCIRPRTTLADTAGGLLKQTVDTASVLTDTNGRFFFDSTLDTGTYVIEAASGNDAVLIDSVTVTSRDSTDTLPPDTLKPAGAIKGVIYLSEGGDPRKAFVLAFGINRFARIEADGRFRFQNLAEAAYDLRIISSLDDYGVMDMPEVAVVSADTTDLDTLELPFTGIPTPRGLTLSYDTLMQIVTLIWNQADTALVKGYNVYRKDTLADFVKINTSLITDTFYVDSTVLQDETYEYKIVAVDPGDNEGDKSAGDSIFAESAYSLVDSIGVGILDHTFDLLVRSDGKIYVSDDTTGIKIFSSDGVYGSTIACSSFSQIDLKRVFRMHEDSQGNLFVTGIKDRKFEGNGVVLKLSPQDSLIMAFGFNGGPDSTLGTPMRISVLDTLVFVENSNDRKIKIFSSNSGSYLHSFGGAGTNQGQFVEIKGLDITKQQEIVVAEETRIQFFYMTGTFQTSFYINIGIPGDLKVDGDGDILLVSLTQSRLYGYNSIGQLVKRFQFGNKEPASLYIDTKNNLYVGYTGSSFFEKYHRK